MVREQGWWGSNPDITYGLCVLGRGSREPCSAGTQLITTSFSPPLPSQPPHSQLEHPSNGCPGSGHTPESLSLMVHPVWSQPPRCVQFSWEHGTLEPSLQPPGTHAPTHLWNLPWALALGHALSLHLALLPRRAPPSLLHTSQFEGEVSSIKARPKEDLQDGGVPTVFQKVLTGVSRCFSRS